MKSVSTVSPEYNQVGPPNPKNNYLKVKLKLKMRISHMKFVHVIIDSSKILEDKWLDFPHFKDVDCILF